MRGRTVIFGIDGVPYELMQDLSDRGVMPHFKKLREQGTFKKLRSSIPDISSIAWSSMITGKNAGEHNVYGFIDLIEGTYTMRFPNFKSVMQPAFWQEDDKKYVILNVPSTYPAKEINGLHVSGFVAIDMDKAVYPADYLQTLNNIDYRIDVDSMLGHEAQELFIKDLFYTLEKRKALLDKTWTEFEWDTFMYVVTGSDRLGHFLWEAYHNAEHKHHQDFLNFFKKVDEQIGDVVSRMHEDDKLLMLSDHGMEQVKTNVFVNAFLREKGFLNADYDLRAGYNNIKEGTKAFCLDPGRIYLNRKGKYPKGEVLLEEEAEIITELIKAFESLEWNAQKVVAKIYKRDDIYHGPYTKNAPDLVIEGASGFNMRGNIIKKEIFADEIFTGKHTLENAFIYVNTKQPNIIPENPTIEDVVDIMKKLQHVNEQ
ncbi:hypothetical protein COT72_04055 [archaeon CG10_big_fil_rev_8_21_14_0_10_43_11]|nr:MAG: hypothetical protein COT72_04055 [archaeon CG10_big_fil_rev_8_21_14_0_10_43_11]